MQKSECMRLLFIIRAAYPKYFEKQSKADVEAQVEVWHSLLEDYEYEPVAAGLKLYMANENSGFPPSPGQVIDRIPRPEVETLEPMEAWAMVRKAMGRGIYNAEEEYAKLPPVVQRAVGSPRNIEMWAMLDADTNSSVTQSNFIKAYASAVAREKEDAKMPKAVRELITKMTPKLGA